MELGSVEVIGTVVPVLVDTDAIHEEETEKKFLKEFAETAVGNALKIAGFEMDDISIEDEDVDNTEMRVVYVKK